MLEGGNLRLACKRVVQNGGAPGVDGVTTAELREHLWTHRETVREQLRAGTYRPSPVKRVEIPKPGGGVRLLGIPTVMDRLIQQALLQVLTPIFDVGFSSSSFGFRPGRRAHDAVRKAQAYIRDGYRRVVDMDLEKFFDRVNHDILMARVARKVKDKRVLKLIRAYLGAGVMANGVVGHGGRDAARRTAQPASGEHSAGRPGQGTGAKGTEVCPVRGRLQHLRGQQTGGRTRDGIGDAFCGRQAEAEGESGQKRGGPAVEEEVSGVQFSAGPGSDHPVGSKDGGTLQGTGQDHHIQDRPVTMEQRIRELNRYITGWVGYFRIAAAKSHCETLDQWIRRRLRMCLWKQWKRIRTRYRELRALGVPEHFVHMMANSRRGPWEMSRNLNNALDTRPIFSGARAGQHA